MAQASKATALRDAVAKALEAGGDDLLTKPKAFYSTLSDFVGDNAKIEMKALRTVLADRDDAQALAPLAALGSGSGAADVRAAIERVKGTLAGSYLLNDEVSASCATGLGEGVAQHLGIKLGRRGSGGGTGGKKETTKKGQTNKKDGGTTTSSGGAGKAMAEALTCHLKVDVPQDKLEEGWYTTRTLTPMYVGDTNMKPKVMQGAEKERVRIKVRAGSLDGDQMVIPGKGYYGPDNLRGDLVVTFHAVEPKHTTRTTTTTTTTTTTAASEPGCLATLVVFLLAYMATLYLFVMIGLPIVGCFVGIVAGMFAVSLLYG